MSAPAHPALAREGVAPGPPRRDIPRARRPRPTLRTVLLVVNLVVLLLPVGGVFVLRLYESVLVRRAEAELLAQGAVVVAAFRAEVQREAGAGTAALGRPLAPFRRAAPEVSGASGEAGGSDAFQPVEATLDLAIDPVLDVPSPPGPARGPAEPPIAAAGKRMSPILAAAQRSTLAGVRIVDARGTVVGSSRGELDLSLARREEVLGATHGETVSVLRRRVSDEPPPPLGSLSRATRVRVFVALPVRDGERVLGAVILSRTPRSIAQSLYGVRGALLSLVLAYLIAVTLLTLFVSWTVSRPLRELIRRTQRVAAGDRGAATPLASPGTREVEQLAAAFAAMAEALERRADAIRALASSVSHEFKTPLAAMRGTVELLRDHLAGMSDAERERFLANLEEDVQRLDRLVSGLMDLARADVPERGAAATEVGPVLERVALRLREGRPGSDGAVEVVPPPPGTRVRAGASALEAIALHLAENALLHGGPGVRVTLAARRETRPDGQDGVVLVVSDDGRGISEANLPHVFDPFFTTARESGGTGLGLAVVRSLAGALGGDVTLSSRPGETASRVWLPSA